MKNLESLIKYINDGGYDVAVSQVLMTNGKRGWFAYIHETGESRKIAGYNHKTEATAYSALKIAAKEAGIL